MHSFIEKLLFFKKIYTKKIEKNKVRKLKKINQFGKIILLKKTTDVKQQLYHPVLPITSCI